ncbi:flagellar export protein FliJ [Pseudoxanthomonas indica]|uniref:Flagellar FliJ protein n=1 Tax=Pseudoxanthomonas indica TaxID=428993 RepID=A0A1T5LY12_9GAMM|nr:flagellar export protein FliJ [Pseudoxanthomonas indica]GGD41980.1 flagellar export protein FliJ [Pseudoxanthomonas indica]SKC80753.1 flagellar FliJ protein [Pseudoxanthomonas indica]
MMQSRRFDPLLRRAQEKEDAVARDLAERQRTLDTQESRLEELRKYAEEYAQSQMAATSPAQLANRRAFLDRLDSAVKQQAQTVDRSRASVGIERDRLLLAGRDKKVLEQLAASYRVQEAQVVERRIQREMDDVGARRSRLAATAAAAEEAGETS